MARPDYSPRGIGAILDDALRLYRANFRLLFGATALVLLPVAAFYSVTQSLYMRGFLELVPLFMGEELPSFSDSVRLQILGAVSSALAPAMALARAYIDASIIRAAPALHAGEAPALKAMLRSGFGRFGWYLLASWIVAAAAGAATLLLIVPGVLVGLGLALAPAITVIEEAPLDRAMSRSWSLASGRRGRIFLFVLSLYLLVIALETSVGSPNILRQVFDSVRNPEAIFQPLSLGWKAAEGLIAALALSLVTPFQALAVYLFYTDMRARAEGMDLVVRARDLATDAT